MSAQSHTDLVNRPVRAFAQGDLVTVGECFAEDAVWELPGRGTLAGQYKGPEAIVGFLARAYELSGGTLALEVLDVLASERGAAHIQRVTAHRDGRQLDCVEILGHEIENGKIVGTCHRPDQYAIDAFFG